MSLWHRKKKLQQLIFPDGILYNKEIDRVRTSKVNSLFAVIPLITRRYEENKNARSSLSGQNSRLVARRGIERYFISGI